MIVSHKISEKLFLVLHSFDRKKVAKVAEPPPVDHILVYDCSGSMAHDLPKIREQMKKKLPKMLGPKDTVSMIWFSGKGQFGVLLEAEPVATLTDLEMVNKAIDRWLAPQGMTGFKEPLVKAEELAKKLAKKNPKSVRSLLFFTDGWENQWAQVDVLRAVDALGEQVQSATFIEYGMYVNRPLLFDMAARSGGLVLFAEDFDKYAPEFERVVTRKLSGAKRVEEKFQGDPIGGFVFALADGDLTTYSVEKNKVVVPADLGTVAYLSATSVGVEDVELDGAAAFPVRQTRHEQPERYAYAALSLFAARMRSDIVLSILKSLGDAKFIVEFATCFGKQRYSAFMQAASAAAFDPRLCYMAGYNPDLVPPDNAFTILDVLQILEEDSDARVMLNEMKYTKIGLGRLDAADQLSDVEKAEVEAIGKKMAATKDLTKLKELTAKLAEIGGGRPGGLRFERMVPAEGLPIQSLTFNQDRPNISLLVKIAGTVDLTERLKNATGSWAALIPSTFPCHIFRNYTLVKDGLVHVKELPVRVGEEAFRKLKAEGVVSGQWSQEPVVLHLGELPVMNRKMVKALSAESFFQMNYALVKAKAAQKVYKNYAEALCPPKKSVGWAEKWGDEAAAWLKDQGLTEYSGYQPPHTVKAEAKDLYMGKELSVSMKGLSSLPKVSEVQAKILSKDGDEVAWVKNPKLNLPSTLMAESIREVETFLGGLATGPLARVGGARTSVIEVWLASQTKASIAKARGCIFAVAQATFVTCVGQTWFFESLDETTYTLEVDGNSIECKVEMKEIEIPIG